MKKIIHIIVGLNNGGAENMLYKMLKYSNNEKFYFEVISLTDKGTLGEKIENLGIKVHTLNLNKTNLLSSLSKTMRICRNFDYLNCWMYHAEIFGFIISKLLGNKKIIWNVRHSNLDKNANSPRTLKIAKINSFLSNRIDFITYNSYRALENHIHLGYSEKNAYVISNGFELEKFKYNEMSRNINRKALQLSDDDFVYITVGRWNVQKDYHTLFKALEILAKADHSFKLIMVGTDLDYSNSELLEIAEKHDVSEKLILLGMRTDIPELLATSDAYISSSLGESFSNAIGEAMACEIPCVVTDVGDSKIIIGNTGLVAPSQDEEKLAARMLEMKQRTDIKKLGKKARERIESNYNIKEVVIDYENKFYK